MKVFQFVGNWNEEKESYDFTKEKLWDGYIVMENEYAFEGIIGIPQKEKEVFIYGKLVKEVGIVFMEINNEGMSARCFEGVADNGTMVGAWNYYDAVQDITQGHFRANLVETDAADVKTLFQKLESFKQNMSRYSDRVYQNTVKNLNVMNIHCS